MTYPTVREHYNPESVHRLKPTSIAEEHNIPARAGPRIQPKDFHKPPFESTLRNLDGLPCRGIEIAESLFQPRKVPDSLCQSPRIGILRQSMFMINELQIVGVLRRGRGSKDTTSWSYCDDISVTIQQTSQDRIVADDIQ